jgi:hypothetical protein
MGKWLVRGALAPIVATLHIDFEWSFFLRVCSSVEESKQLFCDAHPWIGPLWLKYKDFFFSRSAHDKGQR